MDKSREQELAEQVKAAMERAAKLKAEREQQALTAAQTARDAKAKKKLTDKANEELPQKILAFIQAEKTDSRTNQPLVGITTAELMQLAFSEENANSIRYALWALHKAGLVGKTGLKRSTEKGKTALEVWDVIEKCPPQDALPTRYTYVVRTVDGAFYEYPTKDGALTELEARGEGSRLLRLEDVTPVKKESHE